MLPVEDRRDDYEKRLCDICLSSFFIWDEDVYRRIEANIEVDIRYKGEGIPCMHMRTGDLTIIDREA